MAKKSGKSKKPCRSSVGLNVKGPHIRSCPGATTLPKTKGYKPSREKCIFLASQGIFPAACASVGKRKGKKGKGRAKK